MASKFSRLIYPGEFSAAVQGRTFGLDPTGYSIGYLLAPVAMMSMLLCLSHGAQDLYPDFIRLVPAVAGKTLLGMSALFGIPVLYNIGAIAGAIYFGHLSQR